MTHKDFVKIVATLSGLTIAESADAVGAALAVVATELRVNGECSLKGIGKLVRVHRPARPGRNPKTGEKVLIPESQGVKFKRSVSLEL